MEAQSHGHTPPAITIAKTAPLASAVESGAVITPLLSTSAAPSDIAQDGMKTTLNKGGRVSGQPGTVTTVTGSLHVKKTKRPLYDRHADDEDASGMARVKGHSTNSHTTVCRHHNFANNVLMLIDSAITTPATPDDGDDFERVDGKRGK
jgi:hypothetical protein